MNEIVKRNIEQNILENFHKLNYEVYVTQRLHYNRRKIFMMHQNIVHLCWVSISFLKLSNRYLLGCTLGAFLELTDIIRDMSNWLSV